MLYLFDLGTNSSYKLVLNGNVLYGLDSESKTMEFYLNDKEHFVLEYLAKNSSSDSPSDSRDIELAYQNEFSDVFGLYSLKNTIASIRKKYKLITDSYSIDSPKELINNVFKKGYYVNMIDNAYISKHNGLDINEFKLNTVAMLLLFFKMYRSSLIKKLSTVVALSTLFLAFMYILQIINISSIINKYKLNTDLIAEKVLEYGCNHDLSPSVLNQSLNLDSALLVGLKGSCLIDREKVQNINNIDLLSLLKQNQFVYTKRTNQQGEEFYARISKKSISGRYENTLLPFLTDSVHIDNELGKLLSTGEPGDFKIFSHNLRDDAWVTYYSNDIVYEWLTLLVIISFSLYMKNVYRFFHFVTTWVGLQYKLEVIMDTKNNHPIYYEVLTRVKKGSPLDYINNIRKSQLVTFHTILTIRAIEKSQLNGKNNNYGINLCPTILKGEQFTLLKNYLTRLEANEVTLEITENSNFPYTSEIIENILHLKDTGFIVALDDFGTGNNNIEIVRKIQPNYLKIEKDFLIGIEEDSPEKEVLINLSKLGHLSNSELIQEGVETIRQKNFLFKLGHIYQQGYLYSEKQ
ncbi:EAL domain-containing protein [Vibrio makurazakiensis]|uniref:EAL domain-containing protein n=1 Tax=Vibrio makurazakiensis TaxID=2910250 RepID=UPI003D0E8A12